MYTLLGIVLGGGFLGFLEFLLQRHDKKDDRYKEIVKELAEIRKEVQIIDAKGDRREAVTARVRILHFADELLEGRRHSKDSYDQVLSDITLYTSYCEHNPKFKNDQTAATISFIKKSYDERLEKRDFL